jgi:hypothetical protein
MTARSEFRYRPSHVARNDESESISLTAVRLLAQADAATAGEELGLNKKIAAGKSQ